MSRLLSISRRKLLAACTALVGGSLAGCTLTGGQGNKGGAGHGAASIIIHNETSESKSISLDVTDTNNKTWMNATTSVAPHKRVDPIAEHMNSGTDQRVSNLPTGNDYTVDVAVDGGPSETLEWQDVRLEYAPLRIIIGGSKGVVFALQVDHNRPGSVDPPPEK